MSSNIANPLTHGNARSDDDNYERDYGLFGASREVILYDWTIRGWRKMVVQPLRKASDAVDVANPDAQLGEEPMPHSPVKRRPPPIRTAKSDLQLAVEAYLLQHGPTHTIKIARDLGRNYRGICSHFEKKAAGTYCRCGRRGKSIIWGLVGVHDAT